MQLQFALANGRVIFTQDTDFLRINQSIIYNSCRNCLLSPTK
ncbi:MAG: hypothetical protein ACKO1G_15355 [Microcystis aeruginosa]